MTTKAQGQVDWHVLSDLCCLPGVSGHEAGIRAYLDRQLTMCQQGADPLGSGLYSLAGQSQSPLSLLFSTHMDEIGWVVRAIDGPAMSSFRKWGAPGPIPSCNKRSKFSPRTAGSTRGFWLDRRFIASALSSASKWCLWTGST